MDETTQQPATGTPAGTPEQKSSMMLLVVGLVVVIVAIGAWFVTMRETTLAPTPEATTATETATMPANPEDVSVGASDAATAALKAQGASDEAADISADLNATDLKSLDDVNKL